MIKITEFQVPGAAIAVTIHREGQYYYINAHGCGDGLKRTTYVQAQRAARRMVRNLTPKAGVK